MGQRWLCAILVALVSAVSQAQDNEALTRNATDEEAPEPPGYDWPAFNNWDCVDVEGVVNWDDIFSFVLESLQPEKGGPSFLLPEKMVNVLLDRGGEAFSECPLGSLYFVVLYTYEIISGDDRQAAVLQADFLQKTIRKFPFFVVAASRWPVWEALAHFSQLHRPTNDKAAKSTLCLEVESKTGIDWRPLLEAALRWSDDQLKGLEPGEGDIGNSRALKGAADIIYKQPATAGLAAQEECPFGFLFLCTTQAMAAAVRVTGSFEAWARALDRMLAELPFFSVAGSQWPTYRILAMFSSLSHGDSKALGTFQQDIHRWGGIHPQSKRFRRYGDLRLTVNELCPFGRDAVGWAQVDQLVGLSAADWYAAIAPLRVQAQRPIMAAALDAILAVVRSSTLPGRRECGFSGITEQECLDRGCSWQEPATPGRPWCLRPAPRRKVVAVTFVWGERWAALVPRFAGWAAKLGIGAIIVAMGQTSRKACEAATKAQGSTTSAGIACWDPLHFATKAEDIAERGSILQRHAIVHLLLHLGVDALAFDFDTFFFADPRPHLEALAEQEAADVLMARHLDADCLNMGLLYVRASARTAEWYSRYLEWLHQHPYEREQRGANALLGFTKQAVSFFPMKLPQVKALALDDSNEFASSRGGWLGNWSSLFFFHWVNPERTFSNWPDIKVADVHGLYEAALHHSTDLSLGAGSFAKLLGDAEKGSYLFQVREVMDSMRTDALPDRRACW